MGHCADRRQHGPRGSRHYNLALGDRRAHAVRDHLIDHGVAPSRMEAISFGEDRPVAEGSSVDGLARNRNTLTVIIANDAR
ncbi:OmpA family protein [Brevundimonas sp. GCM10030266]|uniref:OmpA family protein n=1 Tax=Brevundimonas sp. GCM10030266 TaxID=3273386 RepID=UPI00361FA75B